jgi:tRNA dimethylallyltransferase
VAKVEPALLVILGETASGKTALALELAEALNGEIICADSWTVYKGFDIGTAKPTPAEQAQVPHHLLDIADPAEGFSAAVFQRLAQQAINDIAARGRLPILVGGTGLYIDSVIYNYSFLPAAEPQVRQELNALSLEDLLARAQEQRLDLSTIDTRNKRRVIRLIENEGVLPSKQPLRDNTVLLGIERSPDQLRARIEARLDAMVAAGLVDEVRRLGELYGYDCEPMKAPAYRAFAEYIRGNITLDMAKQRSVLNDLKLAKKQRTWFKRNSSIHWVSDRSKISNIVDIVTTNLNK